MLNFLMISYEILYKVYYCNFRKILTESNLDNLRRTYFEDYWELEQKLSI